MDVPDLSDEMEEDDDDIGWDDDDNIDDENEDLLIGPVKCLFSDRIFNSANEVFSHCANEYSFNFLSFCCQWSLDCIGYIKLVNFIRSEVRFSSFDIKTFIYFIVTMKNHTGSRVSNVQFGLLLLSKLRKILA